MEYQQQITENAHDIVWGLGYRISHDQTGNSPYLQMPIITFASSSFQQIGFTGTGADRLPSQSIQLFPTLVKMEGYTIGEIPVNHRPRTRGLPSPPLRKSSPA